jgi:hypothetical protein
MDQLLATPLEDDKVVVVGFFPLAEQTTAFAKAAVADEARSYFAVVGKPSAALTKVQGQSSQPAVTVMAWFNQTAPITTADSKVIGNLAALDKFIAQSSAPFSEVEVFGAAEVEAAKTTIPGVTLVEF